MLSRPQGLVRLEGLGQDRVTSGIKPTAFRFVYLRLNKPLYQEEREFNDSP
jgi:hypothetical protein